MSRIALMDTVTETISEAVNGRHWEQTSKRWSKMQLANKLVSLRLKLGLSRRGAAEKAGIPESALRNYELQKSLPKDDHLEALAALYEVRVESLRIYDFQDEELIAQALFQFAESYGLEPVSNDMYAALSPTTGYMRIFLTEWAHVYSEIKGDDDRGEYENWKDTYFQPFQASNFPRRYEQVKNGSWILIEPWQKRCLAKKLPELRERCNPPLTQASLASETGISLSTIQSYEQGNRVPKYSALEKLSRALSVSRGALVFTDFGSPVQASHALFQLANSFSFVPMLDGDEGILVAREKASEHFIDRWCSMASDLSESGRIEYSRWKDRCVFYSLEEDEGWKSRFSPYAIRRSGKASLVAGSQSPFCAYDERFNGGYPSR